MNMLIAIMSDTYGRVQENSASADARSLAEMMHELEEITRIFTFKFKGSMVGSAYKFSFFTKAVTEEDLETLALQAEGEGKSKGQEIGDVISTLEQGFGDMSSKMKKMEKRLKKLAKGKEKPTGGETDFISSLQLEWLRWF